MKAGEMLYLPHYLLQPVRRVRAALKDEAFPVSRSSALARYAAAEAGRSPQDRQRAARALEHRDHTGHVLACLAGNAGGCDHRLE